MLFLAVPAMLFLVEAGCKWHPVLGFYWFQLEKDAKPTPRMRSAGDVSPALRILGALYTLRALCFF